MRAGQTKKLVLMATFAALSIVVGFIEIPWPAPIPGLKIDFSEVIILISMLFLGFPRTVVVVVLRSLLRELLLPKGGELIPYVGEFMAVYSSIVLLLLYKFITWATRSTIHCIVDMNRRVKCNLEDNPNLFIEPINLNINKPFEYKQPPFWKLIIHSTFIIIGFTFFMLLLNVFITVPIYVSTADHFFVKSFLNDSTYNYITQGDFLKYLKTVITIFGPFNLVKAVLVMVVFEITKFGVMRLDVSRV